MARDVSDQWSESDYWLGVTAAPVVRIGLLAWRDCRDGANLILRKTMPKAQLEPIQVAAPIIEADRSILTPEAVSFLKDLSRNFEERRQQLLARRRERQQEIDRGVMPQFLPQTAWIRDSD